MRQRNAKCSLSAETIQAVFKLIQMPAGELTSGVAVTMDKRPLEAQTILIGCQLQFLFQDVNVVLDFVTCTLLEYRVYNGDIWIRDNNGCDYKGIMVGEVWQKKPNDLHLKY